MATPPSASSLALGLIIPANPDCVIRTVLY